tara:strand:+ start:278 stop:661 length:384 start_codon:yes stop_codon:yes gene_type:complete
LPHDLANEFWRNAKEEILVRPVCQSCGKNFFSPQVLCPDCQSGNWEYEKSCGEGFVYSYTVIHRPPDSNFPSPFVVADIQLDEGWRMFSWVTNALERKIQLNDRVKVAFADFSGRKLPVFELERETI